LCDEAKLLERFPIAPGSIIGPPAAPMKDGQVLFSPTKDKKKQEKLRLNKYH
jgi:hypothetical protein